MLLMICRIEDYNILREGVIVQRENGCSGQQQLKIHIEFPYTHRIYIVRCQGRCGLICCREQRALEQRHVIGQVDVFGS